MSHNAAKVLKQTILLLYTLHRYRWLHMYRKLTRSIIPLSLLVTLVGCGQTQYENITLAQKGIYDASISPNLSIVIGSVNHGGSFWKDSERLYNWNHQAKTYSTIKYNTLSDNNAYAVTADTRSLVVWDTQTGQSINFWQSPDNINALTLSPKGNFCALGLRNHNAVIFDALNGGIKQTMLHQDSVNTVDINHTGSLLLTGSDDNTAALWDVVTGKQLKKWEFDSPVKFVKFSTTSDLVLISPINEPVRIYNVTSHKLISEFKSASNYITAATFSSDKHTLYVGDNKNRILNVNIDNGEINKRWNIPQKDTVFKTRLSEILALAEVPHAQQTLWAVSSDGKLYLLPK